MIQRTVRIALVLPFALAGSLAVPLAAAQSAKDTPDAQTLYQRNCVRCHGPEVFTRPDHKIRSLKALGERVRWCESNLELRWFDEDIDAVTAYVNDSFYHFKP